MKTLANLTIGTELEETNQNPQFGIYSDIIVTDIKETKTGRLQVSLTRTYTSPNGEKTIESTTIGHNALDKCTLLSDYCFKIK